MNYLDGKILVYFQNGYGYKHENNLKTARNYLSFRWQH
jgi:hypothetical protein